MLKIIFHLETLKFWAFIAFGDQAVRDRAIGKRSCFQEGGANTMKYFLSTRLNYPTMAEAYRIRGIGMV